MMLVMVVTVLVTGAAENTPAQAVFAAPLLGM